MKDIEIPLGRRTAKYRFFEMLPAILSYSILLCPVVLSFFSPLWASVFIIGYIILWFVKAVGIAFRTIQGYGFMERAKKVDWQSRLADLENPGQALERLQKQSAERSQQWGLSRHKSHLEKLLSGAQGYLKPGDVYNAVIISIYNETEVIADTVKALMDSQYDTERLILIIGYEERGPVETHKVVRELVRQCRSRCRYVAAVMHPKDIPGEVVGKGGNITYAGHHLTRYLKEAQINPTNVIVTTLDCDNRPHPAYLASLTYEYCVEPERDHRSFQPVSLYINNIWDAPAPMRVLATGNSFWTIINAMRPHMLRNFSSHAQGASSLIKTDLWSTRTIVEDGHQYWRSYFAFDGNYEVLPIYVPIYQDAVLASTYMKTVKAQFVQLRRWAYGASDVAYVADKGFRKGRTVPLWGLIGRFLRLLENHTSWAAAAPLVTFGAWAPLFINSEANRSIVAHELPQIASQLQRVAMIGIFIVVFLAFKILPPRPQRYKRHRNVLMLLQWLMMPVITICYGSVAAFNAQTRLLIGKYLDKFDVTVKAVKK